MQNTKTNPATKAEFAAELENALRLTVPNVVRCSYMTGAEIPDPPAFEKIIPNAEYVTVICNNKHRYFIDVTGNSLAAIGYAVFDFMRHK
jgi:hypothetical protein